MYFTANGDILQQHLYRIDENGKNMKRITTEEGRTRSRCRPITSTTSKFSSATRPTRASVCDANGKRLFDLGDQLAGEFATLQLPAPEFGTGKHGDLTFDYRIVRPLNFNPTKKYPVIVYVYGGPHAQMVKKS